MKKLISIFILLFILTGCQEVIDIDLNEMPPRLVIDAGITIQKETGLSQNIVRLTTTTGFYDEQVPAVTDAEVYIEWEDGMINFQHLGEGYYDAGFIPKDNQIYTIKIRHQQENYSASANLKSVPSLENVEQKDDGGFLGNQIELKAFFTDPANERNFYYMVTESEYGIQRDVISDDHFNGNKIFMYYSHSDLKEGDEVKFSLYGISESYFNYLSLLLSQSGGGNPFSTSPSTVFGNIVNETNSDNYAFGYFRISEVSTLTYVVE